MKTSKEYIEMYELAFSTCKDKEISLAVMQEMAKDARMAEIHQRSADIRVKTPNNATSGNIEVSEKRNFMASDKQLAFLERLGGSPYAGMSSAQASSEIERLKNQKPKWTELSK